MRNDLKAALDKIDQQYLNEIVGGQEPGEEDTQNDLKVHEENTTIEELEVIPPPPSLIPRHAFRSLQQMVELLRLFSVQRAGVFGHYKGPSSVSCLVFIHSLFSHFLYTFTYFLPSKVFTLICILWSVDGLVEPVVFCLHVFWYTHKWYFTVKFFILFTFFPLRTMLSSILDTLGTSKPLILTVNIAFHTLWHSLPFTFCSPSWQTVRLLPAPCYHRQLCDKQSCTWPLWSRSRIASDICLTCLSTAKLLSVMGLPVSTLHQQCVSVLYPCIPANTWQYLAFLFLPVCWMWSDICNLI